MTPKITITFISFILYSTLFGQDKILFKDNFSNNKNHWTIVKDDEFSVNIRHNAITFKKNHRSNANNGCLWYKKTIPNFQSSKNFAISFNANILSSNDVINGFDFQWGMIESSNTKTKLTTSLYQLDFDFTKVRLSKFDNINGWTYYDWSDNFTKTIDSNFVLKPGTVYKYEIKQIDTTLTVSINNKVVYTIPIEKQSGNCIGVLQCLRSTWRMSKFCIKQE